MAGPDYNGLKPPKGGVAIRMYRIGHGDCFLLAFDGKTKPVFVLIDCGYKPGSPGYKEPPGTSIPTRPDDVVADIKKVTTHIDVAVITHEHQDHVNAITEKRFAGITIGQTWFAWTESESDALAKLLRKKHGDTLKALTGARNALAASNPDLAGRISKFMELEVGGEGEAAGGGALAAAGAWTNKDSMKLFRDRSEAEPRCLYPHKEIITLPGTDVRVFALGPPYDEKAIHDLDPRGDENFPRSAMAGHSVSFAAAALAGPDADRGKPFSARHSVRQDALAGEAELKIWYDTCYGDGMSEAASADSADLGEIATNAKFRRIEQDWLQSAEQLALAMGNDTNNSSLVLAFELGKGGKVLLFAGDAQRGNWVSWGAQSFKDGDNEVDVRELLGRTVLYKVGHHGSHNATLNGKASDAVPNLAWLARGEYAGEFTAMITAVRAWAMQPSVGWDHPLKSIKTALLEKCGGRVFQTDNDFANMAATANSGPRPWDAFLKRAYGCDLYFDYRIESE